VKRDLDALTRTTFDVLVIGGGIVGACTARDAATRGLSVALIERGDFAAGASWNSLKTVHGGLRSLQHLDFVRMREYIGDRTAWLRTAPHLVHVLPVVVPTHGVGIYSRAALRTALAINDLIAADRNRGVASDRRLPAGRLLSRPECVELVPELEGAPITGGAYFCDGQMYAAERLVLEVVRGAADAGAVAANYVEAIGPLRRVGRELVLRVSDTITGQSIEVRARAVVNATGSASTMLARQLVGATTSPVLSYSVALNLMLPWRGHRVSFAASERATGRGGSGASARNLFVVPWRERTIVGTAHFPYAGDPSRFTIDDAQVAQFLDEVRGVLPTWALTEDDVVLVHGGLLPSKPAGGNGDVKLLRRQPIIDHGAHGVPGFVTVSSVRFTTARRLAQQTVDVVVRRSGRAAGPSGTATLPLPGAPVGKTVSGLVADARQMHGGLVGGDVLEHLVRSYGTRFEQILAYRSKLADWKTLVAPPAPVVVAQLAHAVEEEMAMCVDDLLYRRTELGPRGLITEAARRIATEVLERMRGRGATGPAHRA
jgi:glycerol-3-phosphate dehydrogenase